jgi:hypothetical protein
MLNPFEIRSIQNFVDPSPGSLLIRPVMFFYVENRMLSTSKKVLLGKGTIDFADPQSAWTPNLTTLPSTALALGFSGTLKSCEFSTINLTNCRTYSDYEPSTIRSSISKAFLIDSAGAITYAEPVLGVASTNTIFGSVDTFSPSTIGGANIEDTVINTPNPDTITTAIAKLDGWITGAFLLQPPVVTITSTVSANIYGGIQWTNPRRYPFLNQEIPYVTGIDLVIGNGSNNSLHMVITNSNYLPHLNYTNGIVSDSNHTPVNDFRVYSASFPVSANLFYTSAQLSTNGFYISSATGSLTVPASGNVLAITSTNGVSTLTTMSLYLPNLTTTYPNGTPIPIQITLQNATLGAYNPLTSSIVELSQGAPSAPLSITPTGVATTVSANFTITRPVYSDSTNLDTNPINFSTYRTRYSIARLSRSHVSGVGFRYGIATVDTLTQPPYNSYVGNTYIQNDVYSTSSQTISVTTDGSHPLYPAVIWSTFTNMTNVFGQEGPQSSTVFISTIFHTDTAPLLSALSLSNTATTLTRFAPSNTGVKSVSYSSGWTVGASPTYDVFYLSNASPLSFTIPVGQFNSATFPGDRSTIAYTVTHSNAGAATASTLQLSISSFSDDFFLTTYSTVGTVASLSTILTDVFAGVTGKNSFYYQATHSGTQLPVVNTTTSPNALYLMQSNKQIPSYGGTITSTLTSSITYQFHCQPYLNAPAAATMRYNNICSNAVQVSGLYTPDCNASFYYDFTTSNIGYVFVGSNLGQGTVTLGGTAAGPTTSYTNNILIYNDVTGVQQTTLPFLSSTLLRFSTVSAVINATQYTTPGVSRPVGLSTVVVGYNPTGPTTAASTLLLQVGGSNAYVDTYSAAGARNYSNVSTFTNGFRITTNLPASGSVLSNINDGVSGAGAYGGGLSTLYSPLISMTSNSVGLLSSILYYQHTSSLSSIYTNYYTRELLLASNTYIHPSGYNYSAYNASLLGISGYGYPTFGDDLTWDSNYGYRYATFAFQSNFGNTQQQFLYVTLTTPSAVGGITTTRSTNNYWPNSIVAGPNLQYMKVRMHAQLYYSYTSGVNQSGATQWINGFKPVPALGYDDSVFDMGGGVTVSTLGSGSVQYKMQFGSRFYNNLIAVVRLGIAQDGSIGTATPITFQSIAVGFSNV